MGETLHTYECDIINDTTFRINKEIIEGSFAENENGIDIKDEVYHFVRLPIKPDSTNKYIKPENNDF